MSERSSDSDLEYISGSSENGDQDMSLNCGLDSDPEYTSDGERASSAGGDEFITDESSSMEAGVIKNDDESDAEPIIGDGDVKKEDGADPKNGNSFYFEGVEKLLEIWFTRADAKFGENCNLRRIPRYQLEEMLKLVHCEIIDSVSNDEIDSYVLSESSLFVSQRRLILKTCGTTTPLQCLKFLWTLVKEYTGFDCIEDVYYSHKNYKRPHMQKLPYRKFGNEVRILDEFFLGQGHTPSNAKGSAYCLGSMNRDCWYLYTYHAPVSQQIHKGGVNGGGHRFNSNNLNHHHHHRQLGQLNTSRHYGRSRHQRGGNGAANGRVAKNHHNTHGLVQQNLPHFLGHSSIVGLMSPAAVMMMMEPDQTLEILMSELDLQVMQIFTQKQSKSADEATLKSGIHRIIPGMVINDHLFEPCGYSMNGIIKDQGTYMTIHITPEAEFSYVSFETNIAMASYKDIIGRVLDIFKPGKFVLTFFANKMSKGYHAHQEMNGMNVINEQWLRMDNQFCRLEKNDLTYAMYTKFPS